MKITEEQFNFVDGYVVSILDPYLGFEEEASSEVQLTPSTPSSESN